MHGILPDGFDGVKHVAMPTLALSTVEKIMETYGAVWIEEGLGQVVACAAQRTCTW